VKFSPHRSQPIRPQYILLPVNPWFIAVSLVLAFCLNLLPWGRAVGVPDFVALTLVFWNVHQPRRVGIGIAFLMGVAMDVHEASVLGEHALAYALLSYGAITLHRRVLWFNVLSQTTHVLPLFLGAHVVVLAIRMLLGAPFPGFWFLLEALVQTLLWPVVTWLLLAPQRRAVEKDVTRPL
jgi:rod shape-determining protein MreD